MVSFAVSRQLSTSRPSARFRTLSRRSGERASRSGPPMIARTEDWPWPSRSAASTQMSIGAEIAIEGHEVSPDAAMNQVGRALRRVSLREWCYRRLKASVSKSWRGRRASGVPARVVGRTGGNLLRIAVNGKMCCRSAGRRSRTSVEKRPRTALREARRVESPGLASFSRSALKDHMLDKFKDECGVFGIFGHPEAANMAYLGLYALQHRGQESGGIAASRWPANPRLEGHGICRRHLRHRSARGRFRARWPSDTSGIPTAGAKQAGQCSTNPD